MAGELIELRQVELAGLCRLNNEFSAETSLLIDEGMQLLLDMAFYAVGVASGNDPDALLIAFDQAAPYENQNFEFFRSRHERFVYIDRMITATHAQRRGLGRRLYEDLFDRAREAGHGIVGCEVNLDPPNPGSDAFHERLGFTEVGQAVLQNGKTVRYLEFHLA